MIKVAVIGAGAWGRNHVRIYRELEGAELSLVSDLNPEFMKGIPCNTTSDYREILKDKSIGAVSVCTPASTHFQIASECLEAGKHVLVEKPMCLDSSSAGKLIKLAKGRGLTLMVGHTFRFDPTIRKAREEMENGAFGRIYYLSLSRMGLKVPREDCGVIFNYAVHDLDIMCDFLGRDFPDEISAVVTRSLGRKYEDLAVISARFGDVFAYSQVSWLSPVKVRDFWIVGEKKSAFVDTMKLELSIYDSGVKPSYDSFGAFQLITRSGSVSKPEFRKWEPLKMELSHFLDCIKTGETPIASGEVGLRAVKMAEAALKSSEGGRGVSLDGNGDVRL